MLEQSVGEIYIEAPTTAVYDYATHPEHWQDWHPTSLSADAGDDLTPTMGTQFSEVVDLMGEEVTLAHTVTLDERPLAFATQFTSGVGHGTVRYDLSHHGSGTLFKRTLTYELTTPLPKLAVRLRDVTGQAMANLKQRVEALPAD
jgi:uncharacterized protein YndB with AHSA1/START domain